MEDSCYKLIPVVAKEIVSSNCKNTLNEWYVVQLFLSCFAYIQIASLSKLSALSCSLADGIHRINLKIACHLTSDSFLLFISKYCDLNMSFHGQVEIGIGQISI